MRKLILTTVSVLTLGMAAAGAGHAAGPPYNSVIGAHPLHRHLGQSSTRAMNLSYRGIKHVQRQLQARHLYHGPINGQMDLPTRQALARFQARHHLLQSGTADVQTLAALDGLTNGVGATEVPKKQSYGTLPNNRTR
jgi:peptidoglycan hydrolase-like protein with peptidoglycan-binding domain